MLEIRYIRLALGNHDLWAVINHHLPQPILEHIYYKNWLKWSQLVGRRLIQRCCGETTLITGHSFMLFDNVD
ncbi:hypothetical protein PITC_006620 [Penicillium italicum]|uniref:Uncharacterized protein n=1 Tax=Penicillium italicum TaxID=40296 RepID=A0A0A2L837_PENIT|nr:hypothetical protein PITC_006620 [Penicillium italicum]